MFVHQMVGVRIHPSYYLNKITDEEMGANDL